MLAGSLSLGLLIYALPLFPVFVHAVSASVVALYSRPLSLELNMGGVRSFNISFVWFLAGFQREDVRNVWTFHTRCLPCW